MTEEWGGGHYFPTSRGDKRNSDTHDDLSHEGYPIVLLANTSYTLNSKLMALLYY